MAKKRLIPFGWLPGHWGLAGKTRELAKAEYELEGEALDRKRVEINVAERSPEDVQLAALNIDLKYNHIEKEDYDRKKVAITIEDEEERKIALLKIDRKYNKISDAEFDKQMAGIKEEPFIRVAKLETDPANPAYGGIIFDYNNAFVLYLEEHGYGPHPEDDDTVNEWFNELCKNVALEAFDGLGDFAERVGPMRQRTTMSEDVILRDNNMGTDSAEE